MPGRCWTPLLDPLLDPLLHPLLDPLLDPLWDPWGTPASPGPALPAFPWTLAPQQAGADSDLLASNCNKDLLTYTRAWEEPRGASHRPSARDGLADPQSEHV